jgi:hypothetical protein
MREVHGLDISGYGTQASIEDFLEGVFKRDKYLSNLGMEGRQLVMEEAMKEFRAIPADVKIVPLLTMRERGLITATEFHQFALQQGWSVGSAEYQYRKWTGTESAVYDMKYKGLLQYGEYSRRLQSKKLTRGQGYYRYRKHLATKYGVPFRNFKQAKPRSQYKRQP